MKATKKKRFTLIEHIQYGFAVKLARDLTCFLAVLTSNTYGSSSPVAKSAKKAEEAMSTLKCQLDALVCQENPNTPDEVVLNAYYGKRPWNGSTDVVRMFEQLRLSEDSEKP